MEFEVDVSGEDIFSRDYTICISNKEGIIKGFKFNQDLIRNLRANYLEGKYRYTHSKKDKALFKIRAYCIIVYYLFKSIGKPNAVSLNVCRDFYGHESNIDSNLKYFLENLLFIKIDSIKHEKLSAESIGHRYAYLMRKDVKNQMKNYVDISLKEIEKFLKK